MKRGDIILLLSEIFILVVVWIVFNILHNSATSTISETLTENVLPINPDFDTKTLEGLKTRERVEPIYDLGSIIATESSLPTPQGGTGTP